MPGIKEEGVRREREEEISKAAKTIKLLHINMSALWTAGIPRGLSAAPRITSERPAGSAPATQAISAQRRCCPAAPVMPSCLYRNAIPPIKYTEKPPKKINQKAPLQVHPGANVRRGRSEDDERSR